MTLDPFYYQLHGGQDGQVQAWAGRHPRLNPPLQLNGLLKQSLCWWGFANQAVGANHWHRWQLTAFQSLHALLGLLFSRGVVTAESEAPSEMILLCFLPCQIKPVCLFCPVNNLWLSFIGVLLFFLELNPNMHFFDWKKSCHIFYHPVFCYLLRAAELGCLVD